VSINGEFENSVTLQHVDIGWPTTQSGEPILGNFMVMQRKRKVKIMAGNNWWGLNHPNAGKSIPSRTNRGHPNPSPRVA